MNRTEAKVGQASRLPYERAIDSGNANLPLPSPAAGVTPHLLPDGNSVTRQTPCVFRRPP